jgi:pimeloyl-ACP methyl ester carboxylesterase
VIGTPELRTLQNVVIVSPNFGGPNNHHEGAGHPAQLERIKRVADKALADYGCSRIVVVGFSGGGYVALMFISTFPGFAGAANVWLNIHDMAAWYSEVDSDDKATIEKCFGGPPGLGNAGDYLARSPKGILMNARNCDVWINSGEADIKVPPHHQRQSFAMLERIPSIQARWSSFQVGHVYLGDVSANQIAQQLDLIRERSP